MTSLAASRAPDAADAGHAWGVRPWLAGAERLGELVRVAAPVDPEEEMGAIAYLLGKRAPYPAVLFEQPAGHDALGVGASSLWNLLGSSYRRIAMTVGQEPDQHVLDLVAGMKTRMGTRIPPRIVPRTEAPVLEHTLDGDDLDLTKLPIPRHWPLDGGRYGGTADIVVTRDPDDGHLNVGTYRMMVQGPRRTGLFLSPGKDARLHIERAWGRGESLPVVAAWGVEPLFMMFGSQGFPKNLSEYDFIGGLVGEPAPLVEAPVTGLAIPADAEFVVEGEIRPGSIHPEGPFGEFTGYYGTAYEDAPSVEIHAAHFRRRPVLTNALMADHPSNEQGGFFSIIRSARIWNDLDTLGIPGIRGVFAHPAGAGGFGFTAVSIDQQYAGHVAQVLALAAQVPGGAYVGKWTVAVDDDVDPSDIDQVLWAMTTRCDPATDLDLLRDTWSTTLDPSRFPPLERRYGSKVLVDACRPHRHLADFPERTRVRASVYRDLAARWSELGLPGAVPDLRDLFDR